MITVHDLILRVSHSSEETSSPIYTLGDEEELIQEGIDINTVCYLPVEFCAAGEERRMAQLRYHSSLWQEA